MLNVILSILHFAELRRSQRVQNGFVNMLEPQYVPILIGKQNEILIKFAAHQIVEVYMQRPLLQNALSFALTTFIHFPATSSRYQLVATYIVANLPSFCRSRHSNHFDELLLLADPLDSMHLWRCIPLAISQSVNMQSFFPSDYDSLLYFSKMFKYHISKMAR